MITRKLHITGIDNASLIIERCKQYSYAFRLLYKMVDESSDTAFIERFKATYALLLLLFLSSYNCKRLLYFRSVAMSCKLVHKPRGLKFCAVHKYYARLCVRRCTAFVVALGVHFFQR